MPKLPTAPVPPAAALLARQPILDPDGRIRGHELLFPGPGSPSERTTAQLLVAAAADQDLTALTGGLPAWVKVSREFLLTFDPLPLAPGSVVLELEPCPADPLLMARLRGLKAEGHVIALDDYLPGDEIEPLLVFADHVKVDFAAYGPAGVRAVLDRLPLHRPEVVAVNVETQEQRDRCVAMDVELLQGFFFERPRVVAQSAVPIASIDRLRAVVALRKSPSFDDIKAIVDEDPGLLLRLLRFVNSAAVPLRRRVSSGHDALVLLGTARVRQFLLLVLLSDIAEGRPALVSSAVTRGRLCEAIARERGLGDPETAFTAGVLSTTDALLDLPLRDVVATLSVTDELRWALLGRSGPLGAALDLAIRVERNRAGEEGARFTVLPEIVAWADTAVAGLRVRA